MRPLVEIDFVENFGQRFNLLIDDFRKVFSDSLRERIFGFWKLCYAFTSFLGKGVKLIMTFMRIKKTLGLEQVRWISISTITIQNIARSTISMGVLPRLNIIALPKAACRSIHSDRRGFRLVALLTKGAICWGRKPYTLISGKNDTFDADRPLTGGNST